MNELASRSFIIATLAICTLALPQATAQVSRYRGPGDLRLREGSVLNPDGPRSAVLYSRLDKWQFWWEFNRDRFTHAKPRAPETPDVGTILLSLKRALDASENGAMVSSCLLALAKVGRNNVKFELVPLFVGRLSDRDDQVSEASTLALGISGMTDAIPVLVHLARNTKRGRKMVGRKQVGYRTRAAALYGLGLVAGRCRGVEIKRTAFVGLRGVLREPGTLDPRELRNIRTAAIHGISLLNVPEQARTIEERKLVEDMFFTLEEFERRDLEPKTDRTRSHLAPAIASVLGRGNTARHAAYKERLRARLDFRHWHHRQARRSAALALGKLAVSPELDESDAASSEVLFRCYETGKDPQTRYFSLIALGQIGGEANRVRLTKALTTGNKALERPWAAIGLALLEFHRREKDPRADISATGKLLTKQLRDVKNPESRSAFAVALGICDYKPASEELLKMLEKYRHQDEFGGYLCVGLALLDSRPARDTVFETVRRSLRRPNLMMQAAPSLARLGHPKAAEALVQPFRDNCQLSRLAGAAEGLGWTRDRSTVAALSRLLFDEKLRPVERAHVAAALGRIGNRDSMPWNARLTSDMNYRAMVEAMMGNGVGVFEVF